MSKNNGVYDVPEFHKSLYKEQVNESHKAVAKKGDAKVAGFGKEFMPELFHSLYAATPAKVEKPAPAAAVRKRIHDLVHELPEFQTLRKQTVRDPLWSGMATSALSDSVEKAIPVQEKCPDADAAEKMLEGLQHLAQEGVPVDAGMIAAAQGRAAGQAFATAEQAEGIDETQIRNALRQGIEDAGQQITDAESAMTALGYGTGTGGNAYRTPQVARELAKRVSSSPNLKKIIEVAGRLTATARAKRASRTNYARSEIVGVEPTGNIARILPSEMCNLGTGIGTALLFKKLVEHSAMGYSMRGKEKQAKGPIIIAIDQSGSMGGDKDVWAKAVSLALLDAARSEKRAFGVILFDDGVGHTLLCPDPMKVNPSDILTVLSSFSGGGTDFQGAMSLACDWIKKGGVFNKADIVLVTDGEASTHAAAAIKERARELGATIYGIGIGMYRSSSLGEWTDVQTCVNDVRQDAKAVDTIFDNIE